MSIAASKKEPAMSFTLPALPFAPNALEPNMSVKTFEFHHGKHHKAYVDKGNELAAAAGMDYSKMSLEDATKDVFTKNGPGPLFNNVAQHYNHSFFWNCLAPNGGGQPSGPLADAIKRDFGGFDQFKEQFVNNGLGQFGSGWVWLVASKGKLEIVKTPNAETPLTAGKTPILVCDVWEHAYYIDYQNRRGDFLKLFLDKMANWKFASDNFAKAK